MGAVVNLNNVELCSGPDVLADWLIAMGEAIRDQSVPVTSLLLVMETARGGLGTYCQSAGQLDTARTVGLLTLAAQYKADRSEADPLGLR